MTTKFRNKGDVITLAAPSGGLTAGVPKLIGALLCVPLADAAQDEDCDCGVTGVFVEMPKTTGTAWTQNEALYWDVATAKFITKDESGANALVGCAAAPAGSSDATGTVRLNGIAITPLNFPALS